MHNTDITTRTLRKSNNPARLELVTISGTSVPSRGSEQDDDQPISRGPDTFSWKVLSKFGAAGNALYASDFNINAVPISTVDTKKQNTVRLPGNSFLTVIGRLYHYWRRQRRIRAQIAYYTHLPDWALRDIGLQRDQIAYAVRLENGEIAATNKAE